MNRTEAINWVLTVCTGLRLSQAKTLSELVAVAMRVGRISLAEIGRGLLGGVAARHRIKRVWRFTSNSRVEISNAMQGVIARLVKRHKKKPLLVALDWTEIRNLHTLMAAAVMKGRAISLLRASYPEWELYKSQSNLEDWFLMTNLDQPPRTLSDLYGKRITIEEFLRDDENHRNGFALRNIQIQQADRIDRLLLILALAYILLVGIGLRAQQQYTPAMWCSSNSRKQCSIFTIGRILTDQLQIRPPIALTAAVYVLVEATPNRG